MSASVRQALTYDGGVARIGQALSVGFLLSLLGILGSLTAGGEIVR